MHAAATTAPMSTAHCLRASGRRAALPSAARRAAVVRATAQRSDSIAVSFTLNHKVHFGQQVLLVGSHERLGAWSLDGAVPAAWAEGDTWTASVQLPVAAEVEYKFVVKDPRHAPRWETCHNRVLKVDTSAAALAGKWNAELAPVGAPVRVSASYDADSEEDMMAGRIEVVAPVIAAPARKDVTLSPQAEEAVSGIIEAAERVAADLAVAAEVVAAELVAAGAAAPAKPAAAPAKPAAPTKPVALTAKPVAPAPAAPASSSKRRGVAHAKSSTKRGAPAAKAAKPAAPAAAPRAPVGPETAYSKQQLEFLKRIGKL